MFNAADNSLENLQAAWGTGVNFVPVAPWTALANGGDTIAIWSSFADYESETQADMSPRRTTANALAVVAYDDNAAEGWPNNDGDGSIFLSDLSSDPATPGSWMLSDDTNSSGPELVLMTVVDHPGGDVGSPGFIPGTMPPTLPGDYNSDGQVDAADYVVWRKNDGSPAGYDMWRENFGRTSAGGTASAVPEPTSIILSALGATWLYLAASLATRRRVPLLAASRVPLLACPAVSCLPRPCGSK